jgi:HNH endonuclease
MRSDDRSVDAALELIEERPYRCEALHGNDIPHDNRASNLRWGSRRENLADRRRIIAERLRELQAACLGKELEA